LLWYRFPEVTLTVSSILYYDFFVIQIPFVFKVLKRQHFHVRSDYGFREKSDAESDAQICWQTASLNQYPGTDCKQAFQCKTKLSEILEKKVLKSRETVLLSALLLLLMQEAQQEIKSTVTVNTTDMTSRSEAKDGTKETEKEHRPSAS